MSDSAQIIVDIDVTPGDAEDLARKVINHLIARKIIAPELSECAADGEGHTPGPSASEVVTMTDKERKNAFSYDPNGVSAIVGRIVHHTIENGVELTCPACAATIEPGDRYQDAVDSWDQGEDAVPYACEKCRHVAPVQEWDGPYVLGLGHLGVQFDNWPPLKPEFIKEIAALLGHRVRFVQQYM